MIVPSEKTFNDWYDDKGRKLPLQCPLGMSVRDLLWQVWEAAFLEGEDEEAQTIKPVKQIPSDEFFSDKPAKQVSSDEFFSDIGYYLTQDGPIDVVGDDGEFKFGIV